MNRATLWSAAALATWTAGFAAADVDEADFSLRTTENLYDLCAVSSDPPTTPPRSSPAGRFLRRPSSNQRSHID